ncbi:hypothetical protein BDZ97DRAFT_1010506 [Flammula alnicola]|nr:hypothetical protein BDZ97DRAFT_1010506 [Flammula alnicola]
MQVLLQSPERTFKVSAINRHVLEIRPHGPDFFYNGLCYSSACGDFGQWAFIHISYSPNSGLVGTHGSAGKIRARNRRDVGTCRLADGSLNKNSCMLEYFAKLSRIYPSSRQISLSHLSRPSVLRILCLLVKDRCDTVILRVFRTRFHERKVEIVHGFISRDVAGRGEGLGAEIRLSFEPSVALVPNRPLSDLHLATSDHLDVLRLPQVGRTKY